jgi:DNA recombination protein RmuC
MQLDQTVITLGATRVSLAELLAVAAALAVVLLVATVVFAWRAQSHRKSEAATANQRAAELEYRLAELAGSVRNLTDHALGSQAQLARTLDARLDQVGHRIGAGLTEQSERTALSLSQLNQRLAVIDAAQKNLTALSTEMVSLKDILANKQARGAYGQGRMEAIVRDGLPQTSFSFQATLSNGTRPDCLIRLPDSDLKLVIDAKFPLEAFNAVKQAKGEGEQRTAETRLRTDVLRHVKDIADKYLLTGETHETAIMFVPSEAIYADLYEHYEDVIQKAHRARVIVASPNILMLLIQTMQAIVKDAAMREQAGVIKIEVARLMEDVGRLRERVGDLQKHFGAANTDLEKLTVSADRIVKRGLKIEALDLSEERPAIPDAAARPRLVERN